MWRNLRLKLWKHAKSVQSSCSESEPASTKSYFNNTWNKLKPVCPMSRISSSASFSLLIVIQQALAIPVQGSQGLFLIGTALHLFATTSIGIFMGTFARSMPQAVQWVMYLAPTSHYTEFGQSLLFRGAGFSVVWPQLVALLIIGLVFFVVSWRNFQQRLSTMT